MVTKQKQSQEKQGTHRHNMHLEAPLGELRGEGSFCAAKGARVVLRAVSEAREDDNRRAARWRLHLHAHSMLAE